MTLTKESHCTAFTYFICSLLTNWFNEVIFYWLVDFKMSKINRWESPEKKNQTLAHLRNLLKITIFKTIKKWLSRSIITLAKLFWKSPYMYFPPLIIPLKSQHFSKSKSPTELTTDPPPTHTPVYWKLKWKFIFYV